MRKQFLVAFFAFLMMALAVFPVWAQEKPQALVQLLEERLKALKRLQQEDCSPLVSAATLARVRRAEESIRRLFPTVAAQFDQDGWPPISHSEEASSFKVLQVTTSDPMFQNPDSSSESPSLAGSNETHLASPLEELGSAVIPGNTEDSAALSSIGTGKNEISMAVAAPLKPLPVALTGREQALSYTVTDAAEVILGTYLPGELASPGGLYLFYFKNTSDRPVDISARNFTLVDQDRGKAIKVKSRTESQARGNPFLKAGKSLRALLRSTAHRGDGSKRFDRSGESRLNPNHDSTIDADPVAIIAAQASGLELDADDQSRIALCLQELFVNRSDWRYWVQARVLSEYTVKPGEEIIRFVPTGSSDRSRRHTLRFNSDGSEALLNNAEKGLR